ncbi:MAG: macro domain-containing protein [Candidatus Omnitrophica bacterium]|nr:macro domain-containing protein [Candidatus Omnitrophota bacterium]
MIRFLKGDIFQSKTQTLVATVNCVGIMGKGLAKEFRQRFPEMYKEYAKACKKGELQRGRLYLYKDLHGQILCFPTKDNWKGPSKYEFIEDGLKALTKNYEKWGITSIAIPPLGCGMGGLNWDKVRDLIEKHLSKLPIDIEVYEPLESGDRIPPKNPFKNMDKVKLTPSSVYTGEMIRIARKVFPSGIPISRFLLQKIAFFSQMAGVPIKLKFQKYKLGPFDYALTFNVDRLEGLYVRDESPTLTKSNLVILDENKWLKAIEKLDLDLNSIREKINEAVSFLSQYSIPQIELLSSVLLAWVSLVSGGQSGTTEEVVNCIQNWKYQKFSNEEIIEALEVLIKKGWLNPHEPNENTIILAFHNGKT